MEARRAVVEPELPANLALFGYGRTFYSQLLSAEVTVGGSVLLQSPRRCTCVCSMYAAFFLWRVCGGTSGMKYSWRTASHRPGEMRLPRENFLKAIMPPRIDGSGKDEASHQARAAL